MRKTGLVLATTLVLVMALGGLAVAQDTASPNTNAAQARRDHRESEATAAMSGYNGTKSTEANGANRLLTQPEKKFLLIAAQNGVDQVEAAKVIADRSHDTAVKRFAERIVQDHGRINKQLHALAMQEHYEIPSVMNRQGIAVKAKLQKLSGAELNHVYLRTAIKDHEKSVKEFEMASQDATHPAVKRFASKNLPVLKSQLREAKWLASKEGIDVNENVESAEK